MGVSKVEVACLIKQFILLNHIGSLVGSSDRIDVILGGETELVFRIRGILSAQLDNRYEAICTHTANFDLGNGFQLNAIPSFFYEHTKSNRKYSSEETDIVTDATEDALT